MNNMRAGSTEQANGRALRAVGSRPSGLAWVETATSAESSPVRVQSASASHPPDGVHRGGAAGARGGRAHA